MRGRRLAGVVLAAVRGHPGNSGLARSQATPPARTVAVRRARLNHLELRLNEAGVRAAAAAKRVRLLGDAGAGSPPGWPREPAAAVAECWWWRRRPSAPPPRPPRLGTLVVVTATSTAFRFSRRSPSSCAFGHVSRTTADGGVACALVGATFTHGEAASKLSVTSSVAAHGESASTAGGGGGAGGGGEYSRWPNISPSRCRARALDVEGVRLEHPAWRRASTSPSAGVAGAKQRRARAVDDGQRRRVERRDDDATRHPLALELPRPP